MKYPPILCYQYDTLYMLYNNILHTNKNKIYEIVESNDISMILNHRIDKEDEIIFKNKVKHFTKFFDRATIALIKINFLNNTTDYIKNIYYVRDIYIGKINNNTNSMRLYYLSFITSINCIDACCTLNNEEKYIKITKEYGFDTSYHLFIEDLNELKRFF